MKHAWTGGQYSLWRALFGLSLALSLAPTEESFAFRLSASLLCLALAAGVQDRVAAWVLVPVWWAAMRSRLPEGSPAIGSPAVWSPAIWSIGALLLLHALTRGSPYLTFDGRGRSDPGGNWILPRWNFAGRRVLLVLAAGASLARGELEIPWGLAAVLLLASVDPGWIPPVGSRAPTRVFYDGGCGLCHRFVRFLLAEDLTGWTFRFAPLGSDTFQAELDLKARADLPDSVVIRTDEGAVLVRSRGSLHVLARLGGFWRALGAMASLVPRRALDWMYDAIARVRHRLFTRPASTCPIVPAHLARRFDP